MEKPFRFSLLAILAAAAAVTVRAQPVQPLPDQAAFLLDVRRNLEADSVLQSRYSYIEKRTDVRRDDRGSEIGRTEKVFDVSPSPGGTERYRRLISVDGAPPDAASAEAAERVRQNAIRDRERLERETPSQRQKRLREEDDDRRKEIAIIDDAFRVYEFRLTGRDVIEGFETVVMTFAPAAGVVPRTSEGKMLQKFSGRAWIAERSHQLIRVEMESSDDVSFGMGLLARMYKGSHVVFERRPIGGDSNGDGDVWLPSGMRYTGGGRVLLVKKLRVEGIREYSNYRTLAR